MSAKIQFINPIIATGFVAQWYFWVLLLWRLGFELCQGHLLFRAMDNFWTFNWCIPLGKKKSIPLVYLYTLSLKSFSPTLYIYFISIHIKTKFINWNVRELVWILWDIKIKNVTTLILRICFFTWREKEVAGKKKWI